MLGIVNGRVRAKFDAQNREWRSSSPIPRLGGVRAKFRRLKSEIEGFEPSLKLGIGNGGV